MFSIFILQILKFLKKSYNTLKEYNFSFKQRSEFSMSPKFIIKNIILGNCNLKII